MSVLCSPREFVTGVFYGGYGLKREAFKVTRCFFLERLTLLRWLSRLRVRRWYFPALLPPLNIFISTSSSFFQGRVFLCVYVEFFHLPCFSGQIVEGNWVVKRAAGTTPAILGTKLKQHHFRGDNYLETDLEIGAFRVYINRNELLAKVSSPLSSYEIGVRFLLTPRWQCCWVRVGWHHAMLRHDHILGKIYVYLLQHKPVVRVK